jgi:hypothetical protein
MKFRRVVTGHDAAGKAVFASDSEVAGLTLDLFPGWEFFDIWGGDQTPSFPDSGSKPPIATYFPAVEGFRFSFSIIPPGGTVGKPDLDVERATAEVESALPGMMAHLEPDGMHRTDTIDFEIVMQGQVYLQVDDGVEKLLQTGDTVVQNGTRHVWRNPGPDDCLLAVFMVGAHRKPTQ